jgi:peptide/nickel transport system substrate-binding protein
MRITPLRRKAISRSATAVIVIVLVLVVGIAGYYATMLPGTATNTSSTNSGTNSSTNTSTSQTSGNSSVLSVTWANVPNADPAKGSDEASSAALVNLYDSLVYPAPSGALQPDLATSWTVSSDGLTYTFAIRSGVNFHNGDTLTASDVVYSLNRIDSIGQGFSYLFSPYVASATASNPNTMVVTLKQPFGPFLSALVRLYVVDQSQVQAHVTNMSAGPNGDYGSTWLLTHDAGSGPYEMTSANLESNMMIKEFSGYWNGTNPNQPKGVNFIGSDNPSTVQALFSSGQIQITDEWQEYSTIQSLAKLPNAKMVTIPTIDEMYLMINTKAAPTDDLYVREAMSYALNYSAIINDIFPGSQPAAGPVPPGLPGHAGSIPTSHQDVTKALQIIKQSKYYSQLSSYPITYYWVSQVPAEQQMALQFASDMKAIGLTVNVVQEPWLTVVADLAKQSSSPNIVSIEDEASYFEAGSILQSRYSSATQGTWEQNEWLGNATLDSMISSSLSTLNQTQRFQDYASIQQQIYNQYPTIYAFVAYEVRAYYPNVVNWYAANGSPNGLLGYNFFFRDIGFNPSALAAIQG